MEHGALDAADEAAHEILDRFRAYVFPPGPVTLDPEYLAAIEHLESLPENRSGADKTWLADAQDEYESYQADLARCEPPQ